MCDSNLTKESGHVKLEVVVDKEYLSLVEENLDKWENLSMEMVREIEKLESRNSELTERIVVLQKENFQLKVKLDRQSETPYDNKDRDEDLEEAIPAFGGQVSDGDLSDMAHEAHL